VTWRTLLAEANVTLRDVVLACVGVPVALITALALIVEIGG